MKPIVSRSKSGCLHDKSIGFTSQNNRFWNVKVNLSYSDKNIFTKYRSFFHN